MVKLLLSIVLVLTVGCSEIAPQTGVKPAERDAVTPSEVKVSIDNFSFSPAEVTVAAGSTVVWVNHDDVPHTVTTTAKQFSSKALGTDDTFSHRFDQAGTSARRDRKGNQGSGSCPAGEPDPSPVPQDLDGNGVT